MGPLLFCRVGHLGFCSIILLAMSLCNGNHLTVSVEGFIECAHCIPVGVTSTEAFSGTGPRMNIDCISTGGDLRTLGAGEVDGKGNFNINFLQDKILEDQLESGSCFLKLDGASGAPCPGQKVQNVLVMIFKSADNVKQTSAMIRKLKFSSRTCTSTILWPYDKKNELPINIPPSPGNSFEYPHQPSVKAFLSPKSEPVEAFPPYAKTFNTSLPPPASMKMNSKPLSALMSRKLLTFPIPFFKPIFPPFPIIQYPSPVLAPPVGNPPPAPIPTTKKPLPPPTPKPSPKPLPPPAPILKKPVLAPPPVSGMPSAPIVSIPKKPPPPSRRNFVKPLPPPPQPTPTYKTAPPPHPQRLVPSTSPPPRVKTPIPVPQPPSPPAPQRKSFSPIPKAPPIPKLPPIPTIPRRYFNSPKSGYRRPSPPS